MSDKNKVIEDLKSIAAEHGTVSRNRYRELGKFSEREVERLFGTFTQLKRDANLMPSRAELKMQSSIAQSVDGEKYRVVNIDKADYGDKYDKPTGKRFQTVMVASDLHDIEMDLFWRRVFIDTVRRVQPDIICFGGDVFDLAEFGKYDVDPREWDVVGRIKYQLEFFRQVREASPDSQIDVIEGNHEFRLLRHMGEATPALKAILGDLHGFTVGKLLGLDEHEINYIARADLSASNKHDIDKEISKNYQVYFDTLMVDHFPDGKKRGLAGLNGHHHKFEATSFYSHLRGSQIWMQLGGGHRREASYCDGAKWNMGFAINHIDTQAQRVVMNYIPVADFAEVGGKFYHREPDE